MFKVGDLVTPNPKAFPPEFKTGVVRLVGKVFRVTGVNLTHNGELELSFDKNADPLFKRIGNDHWMAKYWQYSDRELLKSLKRCLELER